MRVDIKFKDIRETERIAWKGYDELSGHCQLRFVCLTAAWVIQVNISYAYMLENLSELDFEFNLYPKSTTYLYVPFRMMYSLLWGRRTLYATKNGEYIGRFPSFNPKGYNNAARNCTLQFKRDLKLYFSRTV